MTFRTISGRPLLRPDGSPRNLSILSIDGVTWRTLEQIASRTNIIYNPRGVGTSGTVTVRTNLCTNPNLEVNSNTWGVMGSATAARLTTGGYIGPACWQVVTNGAATFEGIAVNGTSTSFQPHIGKIALRVASGTASVYVYIRINYSDASMTDSAYVAQTVTTTWQEFTSTVNTPTAGKTVTSVQMFARTSTVQATTLFADAALIEIGTVAGPYFDGNTTNVALNPGAETDVSNIGSMGSSGTRITRDTTIKRSGTASAKAVPQGTAGSGVRWQTAIGDLQPYASMTFSAYIYPNAAITISPYGEGSKTDGSYVGAVVSATFSSNGTTNMTLIPNQWNRVSYTFTVQPILDPTRTAGVGFLIANPTTDMNLWIDDATISRDPFGEDFTYSWTGTANGSTSIQKAPAPIGWSVTSKNNAGPDSVTYKRANGQIRHLTRPGSYSWNVLTTALNTTGIAVGTPMTFVFKAAVGGGWAQSAYTKAYTIVETNAQNGIGANTPNFTLTSTPQEIRLGVTATSDPSDNAVAYLGTGGASTDSWIDFDYFLIILESNYTRNFFDGDSPADPDYNFSWSGTPYAWGSLSIATPR